MSRVGVFLTLGKVKLPNLRNLECGRGSAPACVRCRPPDNAHAFLNFLMEQEVIAAISNEIRYAKANSASLPFVDYDMRESPSIDPPAEDRAKLHISATRSQEYSRDLNRAWTRIKTGQ